MNVIKYFPRSNIIVRYYFGSLTHNYDILNNEEKNYDNINSKVKDYNNIDKKQKNKENENNNKYIKNYDDDIDLYETKLSEIHALRH